MPQDLARWALLVWVQDKTRPRHGQRSKVSLSVLHCGAKSTLPHTCPPDKTLTHSATMGKVIAIPIQDGEELTCSPMESSPAVAPSSATCLAPSTSIGPDPRGARADHLQLQPPWNPPTHFFQLDVWGRRAQLQLLPYLYIQPTPKGLPLLLHHPLWHCH